MDQLSQLAKYLQKHRWYNFMIWAFSPIQVLALALVFCPQHQRQLEGPQQVMLPLTGSSQFTYVIRFLSASDLPENDLIPTFKQEHFDQLFSEFGQIFGQTLLFKNNTCASFFKVHYSETITGMYCHFLLPCISKLQFMKEKSSKTPQWGFCKWLLSLRRSSC